MQIDRPTLEAAARRLAGQVLVTPLVGQPLLPGRLAPAGLRLKLECLQVAGGLWFRGAMHALARRLGALPGLAVGGAWRSALGTAAAAAFQRIPTRVALRAADLPADARALFAALPGVGLEPCDDDAAVAAAHARARAQGCARAPGPGDPDFDVGIATLALELDAQMPSDVARVVIGSAELAPALERGLAACGRALALEVAEPVANVAELAEALRIGVRVAVDAAGCAAFARALAIAERESVVAVLAS
ncbi:MAG: pyridoxal-phosphate dependent enzyme [Planctomycetes bacterium]|nr:pyridoxal-phosphate dependent enzyme [Planctomycetota bacterium]